MAIMLLIKIIIREKAGNKNIMCDGANHGSPQGSE